MRHGSHNPLIDEFSETEHDPSASIESLEEPGDAIPDIVIRRLPIYARSLQHLSHEGVVTVSSSDLGARLGVSAAQIRRDLSYFGEFGKQGKGYNVDYLLEQINSILGLEKEWPMALVGLGHLGRALLHYDELRDQGFCIQALFDHNPEKVGQKIGGQEIHNLDDLPRLLQEQNIKMAVIAVPARGAQQVADALVEAGVLAILNYAPIIVQVPPHVKIRHIDAVVALQSMTYYLENAAPARSAPVGSPEA
ncbi:MAG TPA: redox-sensing transcriptional repressor Rex [Chloroflexia bacterium]|nr:redox-sensing transcriptional repressor Rex [Chloroflexia bacterium]